MGRRDGSVVNALATPMDEPGVPACLNCGRPLTGPFCAECGQKAVPTNLTLTEFLQETTHELTHWEGKVPSTLKTLFFKPGLLTVDFLAGRRARWLSPLRLYLICSIAYFLSGPLVEAITHREEQVMKELMITNPDGSVAMTPELRKEVEAGLPARIFGMERVERLMAKSADLNREVNAILPKAMFLLLPIFAFFTRLAWGRQLPHYPAHLYLALHVHAALFAALVLLTIATGFLTSEGLVVLVSWVVLVYVVGYGVLTVRRVFKDSWLVTIAKSAVVGGLYSTCLFALSLVLLAYVIMKL
jgi:hypothetical protein